VSHPTSSAFVPGTPTPSVPPPPRTPSARARALVFAYQGAQRILRVAGFVLLLVGPIPAILFGGGVLVDLAIDARGEPCRAEVIETEVLRHVRINRQNPTALSFSCTASGVVVEGRSTTLDAAILERATPGTVVDAEVLPGLGVGRVVGTTYGTMGYLGLVFFLSPVLGVVLSVVAWRSNRREVRAFVHGKAVRGRVFERREDRRTRYKRRYPWRVGWEFTVEGQRYTGALSHMDRAVLEAAIPTDAVVVLYDPKRPATNTVYIE
jgi:hypothetical protein